MDSISSENCFICDEYMGPFKSDLTVVTSFSEKPIFQFIRKYIFFIMILLLPQVN